MYFSKWGFLQSFITRKYKLVLLFKKIARQTIIKYSLEHLAIKIQ